MDKKWAKEEEIKERKRREEILDRLMLAVKGANMSKNSKTFIRRMRKEKAYKAMCAEINNAILNYYNHHAEERYPGVIDEDLEFFKSLGVREIEEEHWFDNDEDIGYDAFIDSEPKFFSGDLAIIDPCNIIGENDYDFLRSYHAFEMDILGFKKFILRDSLYKTWSGVTYNTDINEPIGMFSTNGRRMGVFLLDEILKYNPKYDEHLKSSSRATFIKNFEGMVQFVVTRYNGIEKNDFAVNVVGHGKDKVTGDPINFETRPAEL